MNDAHAQELIGQFTQEARELLLTIGERLMAVERSPDDGELLNDLFRQVHTLKGNCGLFDFRPLEQVVHAAEDILDRVRSHQLHYHAGLADAILDAMDYAGSLVDAIAVTGQLPPEAAPHAQAHAVALRAFLPAAAAGTPGSTAASPPAPAAAAAQLPWARAAAATAQAQGLAVRTAVEYRPEEGCFFKGEDPWRLVRATPGLQWIDVVPLATPAHHAVWDCYQCTLVFHLLTTASEAEVLAHFRFVAEQVGTWSLPSPDAPAQPAVANPYAVDAAETLMHARLQALWDTQCTLLERPGLGHGTVQAVQATLGALQACAAPAGLPPALPPPQQAALLDWARSHAPSPAVPARTAAPAAPSIPSPPADGRGPVPAAATAEEPGHRVLKVAQEKIDRLMDLIGEMVVAKNALPYLAARAETVHENRELAREIKAQHAVINRIAEDMQHAIMQVRMLPVGTVFQRFGRLVRDLSRKLGKEVRLVVSGEDTEADKNVIEALAEPLVHLLRNSLDHGIELPAARERAGKPPFGTITVVARQEGDRVRIEISDDGAGIDPLRIKAKALERGLLTPERAEAMPAHALQALVFAPGFSTADEVTDVSGRGVGMDAVRSTVERINGTVDLHSEPGRGSRITLSLPLTMAVTNVMVIETGQRRFGVPMDMIVETVRIHHDDIHRFKQARTVVLRGRIVPLRSMNELLDIDLPQRLNDDAEHAVLVVRRGAEALGLIVDHFHGTSDIILKPLEGVLAGIGGFAGTALMGDGTVLLVLNPKELA